MKNIKTSSDEGKAYNQTSPIRRSDVRGNNYIVPMKTVLTRRDSQIS